MGQRLALAHLMPYTGLQYGVLRLRTFAEQLSCSLKLLGFVPMHSDSQQFVRVASWFETFTAVTRVRIPSGTPTKTECLAKFRPAAVAYIRKFYGNHGAWFSIFGPTTSAVQLQSSTRICARNGSDRPDLERKLRPTGQQIPFWRFSRESGKSAFEATRSQIATALGPGSGCPSTLVSPNT
jgi:hypothetical protein